MNRGRNSAWADFGPRPGAVTRAQWPKRPDGPSQPTRMRWGAVTMESTSGAGPPRWVRWPAAELTGVTRRLGSREEALAQWFLSAMCSVRRLAMALGSPKAPWTRGGHEVRFKLRSCWSKGTSHQEGRKWRQPGQILMSRAVHGAQG
jgi:hypothetical protein